AANILPPLCRTIQPIDAAMILLIQPIRQQRMHAHAVRVVAKFGFRIRQKIRSDSAIQWTPILPPVHRFEDATAGHADVHVFGIAWVDENRVQLWSVGSAVLVATAPGFALRVLVEARHTSPGYAGIFGTEQALPRGAR